MITLILTLILYLLLHLILTLIMTLILTLTIIFIMTLNPHPPPSPPIAFSVWQSWFGEVKKAVDYRWPTDRSRNKPNMPPSMQRVCFEKLYLPPLPGVPWFWNDWGQVNDCSTMAASPLYQTFNLFLRSVSACEYYLVYAEECW